jgi:erythromycin esterase-like protein
VAKVATAPWALNGSPSDYDALIAAIGDASVVLIGEASHGTHEFYRERWRITQRLILDLGFTAIAIEGDWPDAAQVNRYVLGDSYEVDALGALAGFARFPTWMWRNTDVLRAVQWLRVYNDSQRFRQSKVGFFGLDLYSLRASMAAVVDYLQRVDPLAAEAARARYACFDMTGLSDPQHAGQEYGYAVMRGGQDPCEDEVVAQLQELLTGRDTFLSKDGHVAEDEFFSAQRNATLVHNAELYYRQMYRGRTSSWNLRDSHMVDTLSALREHLQQRVAPAKVVVWAHNSHVGDARATELGRGGQHNVGQLVRQQWPGESFIIGLTTTTGTVTAADDWGGPMLRKHVRTAVQGTFEHDLSQWHFPDFVALTGLGPLAPDGKVAPGDVALERAIGVIYRPETERASHWFSADLHQQFDAVVHLHRTQALEPLDRTPRWDRGEPPETYPSGL